MLKRNILELRWFPRITRFHSAFNCKCRKVGTEASFHKKTDAFIDGHTSSQEVAKKAHERGIR